MALGATARRVVGYTMRHRRRDGRRAYRGVSGGPGYTRAHSASGSPDCDVIDLILVAGVIALSTLVAALVPSVRAALVDPAETLRAE